MPKLRTIRWMALVWLAGCAAAPGPAVTPSTVPTPTASPAAAGRVVLPSMRPGILPPARPSPTAAPSTGRGTTVSGRVANESGNPLYGAGVSIQSIDPKRPYSDRVVAEKGTYQFDGVPAGLQIKVAANVRFHDPRSIMHTVAEDPAANVVDFTGPYALPKR